MRDLWDYVLRIRSMMALTTFEFVDVEYWEAKAFKAEDETRRKLASGTSNSPSSVAMPEAYCNIPGRIPPRNNQRHRQSPLDRLSEWQLICFLGSLVKKGEGMLVGCSKLMDGPIAPFTTRQ